MPSFVSHIELSKDVSDKLCFDNVLTRYTSTYSLGGDLCRFSKCRRLSHRKKKEEFIFNMINYIKENKLTDNKEVMGILYGHISHYIMDDTMHPLVRLIDKESSPVRMKSHTLIEGMIDSYIVKYKYNKEIDEYLNKGMLIVRINRDGYKMINKVYEKTYGVKNVAISYILSKFVYGKIYLLIRLIGKNNLKKITGYDKFIAKNKDVIDRNNKIISLYEESVRLVVLEINRVVKYMEL
ncbi:MAG: zinc dependent phospholipase C family protein [Bacilli bacterium]|nr:zinc dependent phospholipase C family protein [Bacilli bacterium]